MLHFQLMESSVERFPFPMELNVEIFQTDTNALLNCLSVSRAFRLMALRLLNAQEQNKPLMHWLRGRIENVNLNDVSDLKFCILGISAAANLSFRAKCIFHMKDAGYSVVYDIAEAISRIKNSSTQMQIYSTFCEIKWNKRLEKVTSYGVKSKLEDYRLNPLYRVLDNLFDQTKPKCLNEKIDTLKSLLGDDKGQYYPIIAKSASKHGYTNLASQIADEVPSDRISKAMAADLKDIMDEDENSSSES